MEQATQIDTRKLGRDLDSYFRTLPEIHFLRRETYGFLKGEVKETVASETKAYPEVASRVDSFIRDVFTDRAESDPVDVTLINHVSDQLRSGLMELLHGPD